MNEPFLYKGSDASAESQLRIKITTRMLLALITLAGVLAPAPRSAQAHTGTCQWMFSPGGIGSFQKLAIGPPLANLRFGDFNGDKKTDIFTAVPIAGATDRAHQWMFSSGGAENFQNLAKGPPLSNIDFGDFDGDGKTDVFSTAPICHAPDGAHQWMFSPGGAQNFQNLATGPRLELLTHEPLRMSLRFGDFDGDGKTDVFTHVPGDNPVQYVFSSGGVKDFQNLTKGSALYHFGDFDGDGRTDVFKIGASVGQGASQWQFSPGGAKPFQNLAVGPGTRPEFGDFNGDKKTDVFFTSPVPGAPDGAHQWMFSAGGAGNFQNLAVGPSLSNLRFGDFDGDGKTDVFTADCR